MAEKKTESSESNGSPLMVVDLGKRQRKKKIRRLRKGRGKLLNQINDLVDELRDEGAIGDNAQPIVIVVREKRGGGTNKIIPGLF